jgi:hypothetical protein
MRLCMSTIFWRSNANLNVEHFVYDALIVLAEFYQL